MDLRSIIRELLLSTNREGMSDLLDWMDAAGFYESPCSGGNHLAKIGGLAEHSLNVYHVLMRDMPTLVLEGAGRLGAEMADAIIIVSLLHDLGKCGDYGKPGYIPNMIKARATKANSCPERVQSDKKPFEVNKELIPVDHEVRSVKIASKFIQLTEDEELAILWHNGLYGNFKYQIQGKETPLYLLLHFADMWASRVIEKEEDTDND